MLISDMEDTINTVVMSIGPEYLNLTKIYQHYSMYVFYRDGTDVGSRD